MLSVRWFDQHQSWIELIIWISCAIELKCVITIATTPKRHSYLFISQTVCRLVRDKQGDSVGVERERERKYMGKLGWTTLICKDLWDMNWCADLKTICDLLWAYHRSQAVLRERRTHGIQLSSAAQWLSFLVFESVVTGSILIQGRWFI